MKKLGLALMGLLMISSTGAFAQTSFGVKAGMNLSKSSMKIVGEKWDNKYNPGFNVGAFADLKLSDMLAVETGLTFETKGYKIDVHINDNNGNYYGTKTSRVNLYYATIPVDARLNIGDFYVLAGPYLGIALFGKSKIKDMSELDEKTSFGNDKDDAFKRLDIGLGLGAGYEFTDNIGARFGYDLGLTNLKPDGDKDNKITNGSIDLSVTYRF